MKTGDYFKHLTIFSPLFPSYSRTMASILALRDYGSDSSNDGDDTSANTEDTNLHLRPIEAEQATSSIAKQIAVYSTPVVAIKVQ